MSSLDTVDPKAAASPPTHDPVLERDASAPDGKLAPPASPSPAGSQGAGDGSLYLQNAHYGALGVETQNEDGASGNSGSVSAPPRAPDLMTSDGNPAGSSPGTAGSIAPNGGSDLDTTQVMSETGQGTVNRLAPSGESFSLNVGNQNVPPIQVQSLHAEISTFVPGGNAPTPADAPPPANEAPTDIALSNATIDENVPGAVVGTLTTTDSDAGEHFAYDVSDSRFEVVDGELKLKDGMSLDHEGEPTVTINVTSTDGAGHSLTESFTIVVGNVNERPTDIALSNNSITENTAGAVVGTLTTTDPDAGDTHSYAVSDNRFEVVDGQLKLKDGVSLDDGNVTVQVTSTDAGGLSRSENFTITVAPTNEAPTDIALSNSTVSENAAGAVVGTLTTSDPDAGDAHSYSVSDNRFEIVDGALKLKDGVSLDHEGEPSVTVQVTSTDAAGASVSENFTISVTNVNEGPTDIALSNTSVAENAAGAVVGALTTSDPDAGDSHTYSISDDRFEVVDGQLKLKDGISLDHEGEPSVTVQVTSTDASGASANESFTITVTNVNESPTDIGLSNTSVAENAAGAVVGALTTSDPDAGDAHTYSVSDSRFEIVDGNLKLKDGVSLDHEGEPSVTVQVTSTDVSGASVNESFTINVTNVNEGPTDIGLSNTSVAENAAGAVVGTLTTSDPDVGDSHTYSVSDNRFEVVDGDLKLKDGVSLDHESEPNVTVQVTSTDASGASVNESFTINVTNVNEGPTDIGLSNTSVAENAAGAVVGTLTTSDPDAGDSHTYSVSDNRFEVVDGDLKLKNGVTLDHEGEPSVTVQVTSTDAAGASVNESFTINVTNVNEGPTDISLSNASVAENAAGAVVGMLSTADPDTADSHTYSVSDNRFEVVDGDLKLKDGVSLDHEGEPSVTVQVTSTDASGASINESFTISVTNVNEGPTDIGLSNANVAENAAGAVVGALTTSDPDAGDSHTYSVSDNRFEVVDGDLKLKSGVSLDHEAEPNVTVQVTSTDASGASLSENFTIAVTNVNEGPTDISLSNTSVAENAAGAVVGTLSTVDPDAGDSHTYSVSDNRFEVVAGDLKLKAGVSLDHEGEPSVTVQVTSTDGAGAAVSENFTITVTNANEAPTDISLSHSTVAENAAGAVVGTLSSVDPDAGDTHSYSVSDSRFEIIGGDLKLKAGVSLNFEAEPSVSVQVTSTDAGGASYSENFTVGVTNVNEAPTGISLSNSTFAENAAGTVVGTLSTIDPDASDPHTYSVSDSRFEIVNGDLKLKSGVTFDYEQVSSVNLSVTSTDSGGQSVTQAFSLSVQNLDDTAATKTVGTSGNDTFAGTDKADAYDGAAGNDTLSGGVGNDLLWGGDGNDTLSGGVGNDTLDGGNGNDAIAGGAGADTMTGGAGLDTLMYDQSSAGVTVNLTGNTASGGDAQGDVFSGFENITGSAYNDSLSGDNNDNVINAGAGDDRVYVSYGLDTLDGGTGNDTIDLSNFNGVGNFTVDLSQGLDYFTGNIGGADHISNFENASGASGDDVFIGSSGANTMSGQAGNDIFHFSTGAGHDTVWGGTGTDTISVDTAGGGGGWLETLANGATPVLAAGDWLLQLDTGQTYLLHGSGGDFDFGGVHAGVLTAADGSDVNFHEIEKIHW